MSSLTWREARMRCDVPGAGIAGQATELDHPQHGFARRTPPARAAPRTKVVKALNTCNCRVMIDPARVSGDRDVFICGDDAGAKETVKAVHGLYRLADFNFKIVRSGV
jgi:predicted dinucleotide-binding enzyme